MYFHIRLASLSVENIAFNGVVENVVLQVDRIVILCYNVTIEGGVKMETIRPSADLRNHYSEISKTCRETRQPVYITVNGRGDTVLMGLADYEQMRSELELLRTLSEAEEDVRCGRVAPVRETFDGIREALLARKSK